MKILICGSRKFKDYDKLRGVLHELVPDLAEVSEIIEGGASGADGLGRRFGKENGIPVATYYADWINQSRAAGIKRNIRMITEGKPDLVVAFPAADSKGTRHMIDLAQKAKVRLHVVEVDNDMPNGYNWPKDRE